MSSAKCSHFAQSQFVGFAGIGRFIEMEDKSMCPLQYHNNGHTTGYKTEPILLHLLV